VNLILRAVLSSGISANTRISIDTIHELFEGQDLFRWKFADEYGEELLIARSAP
jgi:hypothetical protein